MATYQYTTKPQLRGGLRIILTPRGSSHTVNNMDLSKNKADKKKNTSCMKSIGAKARIKAEIRENLAKLDFLLCLVKYSVTRNEPQESIAKTA